MCVYVLDNYLQGVLDEVNKVCMHIYMCVCVCVCTVSMCVCVQKCLYLYIWECMISTTTTRVCSMRSTRSVCIYMCVYGIHVCVYRNMWGGGNMCMNTLAYILTHTDRDP